MIFHFCFFHGEWRDIYTLCLQSCLTRAKPEKIIVHYDKAGVGPAWEAAQSLEIEWRQVTPVDSELYGLEKVLESGGFCSSLDFVFLKNFEPLRHNEAVIGTQCRQKKKLFTGLIGCQAGSAFVQNYLEDYKISNAKEKKMIAWRLSMEHPVTIYPRSTFLPVAWTNKSFWTGSVPKLRNSFAIHLWEAQHPELSLEMLAKTGIAAEIQKLQHPIDIVTVVSVRSGFLTFD